MAGPTGQPEASPGPPEAPAGQPSPPAGVVIPDALPVLPLRGVVVFPLAVAPLNVGQPRSIRMVDDVMRGNRMLALVAQRDDSGSTRDRRTSTGSAPRPSSTSSCARRTAPCGSSCRAWSGSGCSTSSPPSRTSWRGWRPRPTGRPPVRRRRGCAGRRSISSGAWWRSSRRCRTRWPRPPRCSPIRDRWPTWWRRPLPLDGAARQEILELEPVEAKLRRLIEILQHEESVRELGQQIAAETQERMTKAQREYFLREQLRSIQQELGEGGDDRRDGRAAAQDRGGRPAAGGAAGSGAGAGAAGHDPAGLAEHGIIRTYLDWIADLPWDRLTAARSTSPGAAGPRRGPLRPGEDQGPHPRVPGGAQAARGAGQRGGRRRLRQRCGSKARARSSPSPSRTSPRVPRPTAPRASRSSASSARRASARRVWASRSPGRWAASSSASPGRGARRIGDPRPPPHLHRRAARPHHPGAAARRDARPGLHARRDRQGRLGLAGRPVLRPARSARPGAEPHLPRQLPGGAVRPLAGPLHRHRQHHRHDPGAAARPHGGHPALRLHRRGEGRRSPRTTWCRSRSRLTGWPARS